MDLIKEYIGNIKIKPREIPQRVYKKDKSNVSVAFEEVKKDVVDCRVGYAIKIEKKLFPVKNNDILKLYLSLIFSNNFSSTSAVYERYKNENIMYKMSYSINIIDEYVIIYIKGLCNDGGLFIDNVKRDIKNIFIKDFEFDRKKKGIIKYFITDFDNIEDIEYNIATSLMIDGEINYNIYNDINNMNFDTWNGKNPYSSSSDMWWDSSNANGLVTNVTQETSHVKGGSAARLETKYMFRLAAGSIYLGKFGSLQGTTGATLDFGRPYSCRPLTLKGWYDYTPKTIDRTNSPYGNLNGQSDICEIYCLLTDWNNPFTVNTSEKTFIDFANDPNIIAYGNITNNASTNGWKAFEIQLEYRSNRTPKYCVIVCSSSRYGDYFTGGTGSVLYVDEFEFTF